MVRNIAGLAALVALSIPPSARAITPDNPGGGSVQFTVNTGQGVHAISPYIYGMNSVVGTTLNAPFTLDRLGGNRWTGYNWETNASNAGRDWYYENDNYLGNGGAGNAVKGALTAAATNNRAVVVTVPISGYVAGDTAGPVSRAQALDHSRFKQIVPEKATIYPGSSLSLTPNTSDGYVFTDEFVNWVDRTRSPSTPVFYQLDNEPGLWGETLPVGWQPGVPTSVQPSPEGRTHGAIHPYAPTFAELRDKTIANAAAIKNVNPNALVLGGVGYGWNDFTSLQGATDAVVDPAGLHGDHTGEMNFYEYLLNEVHKAEVAQGRTLMDAIDLHWYPEATGNGVRITGNDNSTAVAAARVQAPRSLFDPTYTETSWITQYSTLGPIKLLPRLQSSINAIKPGTKISITEYNYGGTNNISGGIAEADALGIFGDQNVYDATLWPLDSDANSKFVEGAFKMYLNYNGSGGKYGDTSVQSATSDLSQTSIHASIDTTNPNRMVIVAINRTGSAVTTGLAVTNDRVFDHAEVYQMTTNSSSTTNYQIGRGADINFDLLNAFQYTLPAWSVSTLVLIADGLPGDYNRDGTVDGADYVVWRNTLGTTGDVAADGNEDNIVDMKDYDLWRSNLGRSDVGGTGTFVAAVPEPTTGTSTLIGAVVALTFRRCRSS